MKKLVRKLLKWIVRKGMEEIDKELDKQRGGDALRRP